MQRTQWMDRKIGGETRAQKRKREKGKEEPKNCVRKVFLARNQQETREKIRNKETQETKRSFRGRNQTLNKEDDDQETWVMQ